MIYGETIRSGFHAVNRRMQLVGIQAALMVVNCVGFFIIVGIPLFVAFVIFGLDLTGLTDAKNIIDVFEKPTEFIARYLWLVLIVVTSILLYFLIVTGLGLYVFSGSAGVVGRSILEPSEPFSLKRFFTEARQFFFPLMWYSGLISLVFLAAAFLLGLFGGGIASMVSAAKSQDSTLALFLGIFFSLVLALVAISILLIILAVTVNGIAELYFRREGSWKAFRGACRFLWKHQNAFWLYAILFLGYVVVSFMAMLVSYPFHLIPIVGTIISLPLQLISYMVQGYLGLVVLAAVFSYYYELEIRPAAAVQEEPAAGNSMTPEDTSPAQDLGQTEAPTVQDRTAEG